MQGLEKIMLAMAHAAIDEGLTLHQLAGLRRRLEATLAGDRTNGCPFGGRGKGQAKGAVRRV